MTSFYHFSWVRSITIVLLKIFFPLVDQLPFLWYSFGYRFDFLCCVGQLWIYLFVVAVETMWQMNLRQSDSMESGPYPERPGEPDCAYYIRTGLCRFGMTCRFSHPPNRQLVNYFICLVQKLDFFVSFKCNTTIMLHSLRWLQFPYSHKYRALQASSCLYALFFLGFNFITLCIFVGTWWVVTNYILSVGIAFRCWMPESYSFNCMNMVFFILVKHSTCIVS